MDAHIVNRVLPEKPIQDAMNTIAGGWLSRNINHIIAATVSDIAILNNRVRLSINNSILFIYLTGIIVAAG
jgi:hypothetical protein